MTAPPFQLMSSESASLKRPPALADGKRGKATAVADSTFDCFPLMPVDPEVRQTLALDTPHKLYHTFAESDTEMDIREGDILVIGSNEYTIKSLADWPYDDWYYYEIIVEDPET